MARIRELIESDIPEALEILSSSEPQLEQNREEITRTLQQALGLGLLYGAEEESHLAGLVYFLAEPIFAHGGFIRFLAVRPEKQRRGIGRQLMGYVERRVFGRASSIYVCILETNGPAQRFYERLGYSKVGELTDLNGSGHREWILGKAGSHVPRRAGGRP
jgi:ribosomal protein S18 acetylase RimI-like enzyme